MFSTLRSKLIFSYTAVALLCLTLAVVGTLAFARDYVQRSGFRTLEEKRSLATPLVKLAATNARPQGPARKAILENVQEAIRSSALRVMLVDPSTLKVVEDTSTKYNAVGERFTFDLEGGDLQKQLATTAGVAGTFHFTGEADRIQYVAQRIRTIRNPSALGGNQTPGSGNTEPNLFLPYIVVYAQPEVRLLAGILGDLRDGLLPAVIIALFISLVVAFLLARSISRPVTQLAGATAAMARGDYTQRIPVSGRDELSTLTQQFNEMASEVDRAHKMQRDFVANVSHDLKTPLTSIQGFSQAILDDAVRDEHGYKQAATIINREAQRMTRLVSELLSLTKLENGLSSLELRPADVGQVVAQVALAMQPQADASGVRLLVKMGRAGNSMHADVDRLKQAFGNLIDNGLKHTPPGGSVTVEVIERHDDVQVIVRDSGYGIPSEDLPRVMERFYQIDKARNSGARSLGLGLAIAREIVQAHRGQISLESSLGIGTTVTVTLPADLKSLEVQQRVRKRLLRSAGPS